MKDLSKVLFISGCLMLLGAFSTSCFALDEKALKERAYALYATKNYEQAYEILESLSNTQKNEEVFLIMANILEEKNKDNDAIRNLNKALGIDYTYYKAYYNLGCIFAKKNSYHLAMNNFELAIKYNKDFAPAYYNLACCQMKQKDYENAKKNLIRAMELEPKNKNIYYNLALCYKELNKPKQAKKILDTYNSMS